MGRPKALLEVGGVPMIRRVADALRVVVRELVVVANDPALAAGLEALVVPDEVPDDGPLRGIASGLRAAGDDPCVVVGCDMPFVDPIVLHALLELAEGHDAAVPRNADGFDEALHAVYRRSCLRAIDAALDRGERRAHGFLPDVDVRSVAQPDVDPSGRSWWSVNTPEDLEAANAGR